MEPQGDQNGASDTARGAAAAAKPIEASLFVAMPTATGNVRVETVSSVVRMTKALRAHDVSVTFASTAYVEIAASRNHLVAEFLASGRTHCLFIDDDMGFEPQVIGDMLAVERPFVGVFCPKRTLDLDRFGKAYSAAAGTGSKDPLHAALAQSADFVGRPLRPTDARIVVAEQVGAGILLLRRDVFETLDRVDDTIPTVPGPTDGRPIKAYFDRVYLKKRGGYLSEDHSFCYRWRTKAKGKVFAFAGRGITHHGSFPFQAALADLPRTAAGSAKQRP